MARHDFQLLREIIDRGKRPGLTPLILPQEVLFGQLQQVGPRGGISNTMTHAVTFDGVFVFRMF